MKKDNKQLDLFSNVHNFTTGQKFYWDFKKGELVEGEEPETIDGQSFEITKVDSKNKIITVKEIK